MTLPKLVLGPVRRGGKKHNRQVTSIVMQRLRSWFLRDFEGLSQQYLKQAQLSGKRSTEHPKIPTTNGDLDPQTRRAVIRAVREGALSKAAKLLAANCSPCENPEAALRALHPARQRPLQLCESLPDCGLEVQPGLIRKLLRSFPPDSSGGPSQLKPVHLVEALKGDAGEALLEALSTFCEDFATGKLPPESREWFCGARLIGIPKKPTGIRPIAIGETLRRLTAKALVEQFQGAVSDTLIPLQLGVAVPQAAEIIAQAVQAWYSHPQPDEVVLLVDFKNAYNTLDRQAMLDAVCAEAPQFARYAAFCYSAPTPLMGAGFSLQSEEGTQQGDVCGPLFFALTLHRVLRVACPPDPRRWSSSFIDDVTLCGKEDRVLEALSKLRSSSESIGLNVNLEKC